MAREIKLTEINNFFEEDVVDLVAATTSEWQTDIKEFKGTISNNLPYAEPVCYGENLPPSWGGQYRTRQQTVKGFPELIGKELENWMKDQFGRN